MSIALAMIASCTGSAGEHKPGTGSGGSSGNDYPRCTTDANCSQERVCVLGTCLPPPGTSALPWAVEIRPPSTNRTAIITEIMPAPPGGNWKLSAVADLKLGTTFAPSSDTVRFPSSANVVLEIPSLIPGRPLLTFESTVAEMAATITVPDGTRSRNATLRLIPLSPADQSSPPYRFSTLIPATGSVLRDAAAPTMTNFVLTPYVLPFPNGILRDAFGDPKVAHTARAFLGGELVSNAAITDTNGRFLFFVPATVNGEVAVQIAPPPSGIDPWFIFSKKALTEDLGTVTLPTYQVPDPTKDPQFVFRVLGGAPSPEPVAGATVRATTTLSMDALGETRFWRNAMTTSVGSAAMYLIPGVNNVPREYKVDVVPPPGSPYAAKCEPKQLLAGGDAGMIMLSRRPILSGTVMSALGGVVSGVTVVATRDPASPNDCSLTPPTSVTVVTEDDGSFQLFLDPGKYQLDYDPPSGSSSPRLTQFDIEVNADTMRPVQLPAPAIIEGDVLDAIDVPLPDATIRIYEPRPPVDGKTLAPWLRAETQTDAAGHFRAVVADPAAN